MTQEQEAAAAIPPSSATEALVNGPAMVTLFDEDTGRQIATPEGDVEYWLGMGFSRDRLDLGTLAQEIPLFAAEAGRLVAAAIAAVQSSGFVDTREEADLATADRALQEF